MIKVMDYPLLVLVFSFAAMWGAARLGRGWLRRLRKVDEEKRSDIEVVVAGTLTLLGLVIGFTFAMAVSRYDQRKNYEEKEANAIGTEYLRADLLPAAERARVRELMPAYLEQRIQFFVTSDADALARIGARTAELQAQLWRAVSAAAALQPTPPVAVAVMGMNDMLDSQGYTQAAFWNRIPVAAWLLMAFIALCGNALVGYGSRGAESGDPGLTLFLPLMIAISFFLIADIDSPRGGIIHVEPENLISLQASLRAP
jgi:hypothetical protein